MIHRRDALAALTLAALTLCFFWKLALTNLIMVGVDIFTYFYPYRDAVNQALRRGQLPLWNPYLFMGVPLLANGQAGVLYPLNWLFISLSAPQAINASIGLHVFLIAIFFYLFARDGLGLDSAGAFVGAAVFAFSGYTGSLVEHVNQLQAAAWFPLMLWSLERALRGPRLPFALLGGAAFALQLLAGHAQVSYISLFGMGLWLLGRGRIGYWRLDISEWRLIARSLVANIRSLISVAQPFVAMIAVGVGLSGAQLLPMLELSRLSIRGGGMSFREAVAFSLPLNKLPVSLLPTYGLGEPIFSEYVAFIGVIALLIGVIGIWKRGRQYPALLMLLIAGLTLALGFLNPLYFVFYKLVPGFGLFRVPARWLLLYVFAISAFAGVGAQWLDEKRRASEQRGWSAVLRPPSRIIAALIVVELFVATRWLPYNQPTAPEAFSFLRPSIAYLLSQPREEPFRILSYSDLGWDPGDLHDIQALFADQLSPEAIYQFTVAAKSKEIVAPNLALRYQLQSVDGYDGGILPLARFVGLQSLFLTLEQVNSDGRLRERLRAIPAARWLDLFNVRYIIADKIFDVWVDGIYYDLGLGLALTADDQQPHVIDAPTDFEATGIGVVSYLEGSARLPNDTLVAELLATDAQGKTHKFILRAGRETAESEYGSAVAHDKARAVHTLRDRPNANEYHALFNFDAPTRVASLQVRTLQPAGTLVLHGMTLVDGTTTTGKVITFASEGHFRIVQSGDVKLYEYLNVAPRAQVVHRAALNTDDAQTLRQMAAPGFDPRAQIILAAGQPLQNDAPATVAAILAYEPERIAIQTNDSADGYLFLKDTWYPGWRAWVDGQPATIERADTYFRAIHLSGGAHRVELRYEPDTLRLGALISLGMLAICGVIAVGYLRRQRWEGG